MCHASPSRCIHNRLLLRITTHFCKSFLFGEHQGATHGDLLAHLGDGDVWGGRLEHVRHALLTILKLARHLSLLCHLSLLSCLSSTSVSI